MLVECKKCSRCRKVKSLEHFAKCAQKGYQSFCTPCKARWAKEAYRKKHLNDVIEAIQHPEYSIKWHTKLEAAAYLAGMIDGEGCVLGYNYSKSVKRTRQIVISNTDPRLIEACASACSILDLTYTVLWYDYSNSKRSNKKPQGSLNLYGQENLQLVNDIVPIQCPQKKAKLVQTLTTYKQFKPRKKHNIKSLNETINTPNKVLVEGGGSSR